MFTIHQARFANLIAAATTTAVLVASAAAQQTYTTRVVKLRAGPDRGYPRAAIAVGRIQRSLSTRIKIVA